MIGNARGAFHVRTCAWADAAAALRRVRHDVFVVEQQVPEVLEFDASDAVSLHALATDERNAPIGCARLLRDGHIGRVAVVRPWRSRGVGASLMACLIQCARVRGDRGVIVNSQVVAMRFYERLGFTGTGETFDEAGIPHRVMTRAL